MNVEDLELFVQIADSGSITAASERLNLSVAAASAALKRLEKQLGVELFIRSPRKLRISNEGERFLFHCRQSLLALEEGQQAITAVSGRLSGSLRISMPSDLGRSIVLPWLDEIMEAHPALSLQLTLGDGMSDLYQDRIDMALRYAEPEDSNLVAFHLATMPRFLCVSPGYLETHPTITHPEELVHHNCLLYRAGAAFFNQWSFTKNDFTYKVRVRGNRVSDDGEVVRRWALSGQGVTLKPELDVAEDLRTGRLLALLTDYEPQTRSLWLVCPGRKHVGPAVVAVREHLKRKIAASLVSKKS